MRRYELLYVIRGDVSEDDYAKAVADYEALAQRHGEAKLAEWGKRKLAYPIEKVTEGFYVLISFDTDLATLQEMESRMKLDPAVLRHMPVRLTEAAQVAAAVS